MRGAGLLRLWVLAALGLVCLGCKPKGPMRYFVQTSDPSYDGVVLVLGGERQVFRRTGDKTNAVVELDRGAPSALGALQVELQTPCGKKPVAVRAKQTKDEEDRARSDGREMFYVDLDSAPKLPNAVEVWADAKKDTVRVGDAELTAAYTFESKVTRQKTTLFEPACRPTSPVSINGTEVGTFTPVKAEPSSGPNARPGLLVTGERGTCYSLETVEYSKRGGPGALRRVLRGAQVYPLDHGDIKYFLTRAPTSQSSETSARELVAIPCP